MESKEWVPYNGNRDKTFYDIRLKTGEIIECCYPNSYSWFPMYSNVGTEYKDDDIEAIRHCEHPMERRDRLKREKL